MDNNTDITLKRILKNWVSQYQPPANGRARLLSQAANKPQKGFRFLALIPRTQFNDYPIHSTNTQEWTPGMFTWFFEQSFTTFLQARV